MGLVTNYQKSQFKTYVPEWAVIDGHTHMVENVGVVPIIDHDYTLSEPFDLEYNEWFAIEDSVVVKFNKEDALMWRMKKALGLIVDMNSYPLIEKAKMINNITNLVQIDISKIIHLLTSQKTENETIIDTFIRLSKTGFKFTD